ncbi:MAG: hypothetical protein HZA17_12530, partial [Nitrospirae bacterium]|nr:hypothetical protein [Nitrospirota bacterium]
MEGSFRMSLFMYEAAVVGIKEGLKAGIVWLVFYTYLLVKERPSLIKPFYAGLVFVFLTSVSAFFIPAGPLIKEYIKNVISSSFALFLILSGASLYHAAGVRFFRVTQETPPRSEGGTERVTFFWHAAVFLLTVLFFCPDSAGSVLYLRDLSFLKEMPPAETFMSAVAGGSGALLFIFFVMKFLRPLWIGRFFDLPQILLFLSTV